MNRWFPSLFRRFPGRWGGLGTSSLDTVHRVNLTSIAVLAALLFAPPTQARDSLGVFAN